VLHYIYFISHKKTIKLVDVSSFGLFSLAIPISFQLHVKSLYRIVLRVHYTTLHKIVFGVPKITRTARTLVHDTSTRHEVKTSH